MWLYITSWYLVRYIPFSFLLCVCVVFLEACYYAFSSRWKFNWNVYWDNCRLTCNCKKQYRELMCILQFLPNSSICKSIICISKPIYWYWYNPPIFSEFPNFTCIHLCVYVCLVLYSFITCVGLCTHHHIQDSG